MLRVTTSTPSRPPYTVLGWPVPDIPPAMQDSQRPSASPSSVTPAPTRTRGRRADRPGRERWIAWFRDPDGNVLSLNTATRREHWRGRNPSPAAQLPRLRRSGLDGPYSTGVAARTKPAP